MIQRAAFRRLRSFKQVQLLCAAAGGTLAVLPAALALAAEQPLQGEQGVARTIIDEVTVTAQRRVERLQDVPISITAIGGESLDRSSDRSVTDALNRVPGVMTSTTTAAARSNRVDAIVVRGVSPAVGASATAYYLDSIPFGFIRRSVAPDSSAYDLERVEVLRGPQGTLYGASALNGVVRVLTKDADLQRLEFKVRGSASGTEDGGENYRGDMALSVPIVEGKLAARMVAGYQDWGGWVDKPIGKDANDAKLGSYRLKVNAEPTERLSIDLLAWLSRSEFGAPSSSADGLHSLSLFPEPSSVDYDAYSAKLGYDAPAFTVTSMTSYIDYSEKSAVDFAPFSGPNVFLNSINASEVLAQEITLSSADTGSWRWAVGGIYRDAEEILFQTRNDPRTDALCCTYRAPTDQRTLSKSFAVFGEVTRQLLDGRVELTGGLRYFEDTIQDRERSFFQAAGGVPAAGLANSERKFDSLAPRLVVAWHPVSDTTIYASYGEGFRSGLNQLPLLSRSAPQFGPADPDELKSYELGAKGSLWDGRVNFDTAAFYIDWQGVQQSLVIQILPGFITGALVNAGSASGAGFEFGISVEPSDGLALGFNYSWNDLKVDQNLVSNNVILFPQGSRLLQSPETAVGGFADYAVPLGGSGLLGRLSISANYLSRLTSAVSGAGVHFFSDALLVSRAALALESPNRWTASLYADNLGGEDALAGRDQFSRQWDTRLRPRTIGLQFEFQF